MENLKDNYFSQEKFSNDGYCFKDEEVKFYEHKIFECEKQIQINNSLDLNYYIATEKNLLKYINDKIDVKERKKHKKELYLYIREKFLLNRFEKRKPIASQIQLQFYNFLNSLNTIKDIQNIAPVDNFSYSKSDPQLNDYIKLSKKLKEIQEEVWNNCVKNILTGIENTFNLKTFPQFLLSNEKKVLKYKIQKILTMSLNIPFHIVKVSREYIHFYLTRCFYDFFNDKTNLFDENLFNVDIKKKLIKLIYVSNRNYLKYKNNRDIFEKNLKKYIYTIGLFGIYDELIKEYNEYINNNNIQNNTNTININLIDQNGNEANIDEFNLINSLDEFIHFEYCSSNNKNGNIFYYLIFSYSCLLNNLTQYTEIKDNKDQLINIKTSFTPQLICSSRERQFLLNLLDYIDSYLKFKKNQEQVCHKINYILENYVFSSLIKAYTKVLFDENNEVKINLNFDRIYELIKKNTSCENENINSSINKKNRYYENEEKNELIFNILPKEQINLLSQEFKSFMKNNINFSLNSITKLEDNNENVSFQHNIFNKIKTGFNTLSQQIVITQDKISSIGINELTIVPHDPYNISAHICLCIYGIFTPEINKYPIKNFWSNLINDKRNVDFYFYNWQNYQNFFKTNVTKNVVGFVMNFVSRKGDVNYNDVNQENSIKMIQNNKKVSKFFGKFLAYILATHSVFKFHTISLLGFSLGCNVIKYCLKELNKLESKGINVQEIINNVIFIGGATKLDEEKKHKNLFKNLSGKVINFYSTYDKTLTNEFSPEAIGNRKIKDLNDKNNIDFNYYLPDIINIDLSKFKIRQEDFKIELPNIISQINNL